MRENPDTNDLDMFDLLLFQVNPDFEEESADQRSSVSKHGFSIFCSIMLTLFIFSKSILIYSFISIFLSTFKNIFWPLDFFFRWWTLLLLTSRYICIIFFLDFTFHALYLHHQNSCSNQRIKGLDFLRKQHHRVSACNIPL